MPEHPLIGGTRPCCFKPVFFRMTNVCCFIPDLIIGHFLQKWDILGIPPMNKALHILNPRAIRHITSTLCKSDEKHRFCRTGINCRPVKRVTEQGRDLTVLRAINVPFAQNRQECQKHQECHNCRFCAKPHFLSNLRDENRPILRQE